MTETYVSTRSTDPVGAFRVVAPMIGDVLSGALHVAYDDTGDMPDEFARLLAQLDRVDHRPN